MRHGQYVQFGCGFSAPPGWLNFDASPTLRFERLPLLGRLYTRNLQRFPLNVLYGDIVKGLPVPDNSCKGIYCSHVLEHLALNELSAALANVYRYLRPGGIFRLVVPDLERLSRDYLASSDPHAAMTFMNDMHIGVKVRSRGAAGILRSWLGNSAHLWMWDEPSLREQLHHHGFVGIRRAAFGDAVDRKFDEVEDEGRFAGCLAMQCCK